MRLTRYSDYALRLLVLAAVTPERLLNIEQASARLGISLGHAKKLVRELAHRGYLRTTPGRGGGFALARAPEEIRLGALLDDTEPDFCLLECFETGSRCPLIGLCAYPGMAREALAAFREVLDRRTLADVILAAAGASLAEG